MIGRMIAASLLFHIGAMAATKQVEARWEELGGLISDKKISLVLPDGAIIEGKVASVQADSLALKIAKSSNTQNYPIGETPIPRASVSTIQLLEMRFIARVAGTVIGMVVGLGTAVAIALSNGIFEKESGGQKVGETIAIIGLPVVGFLIGRSVDRKVTLIKVIR
jgi:hypothetical protein